MSSLQTFLRAAFGEHDGAQQRRGQPPLATQWHQAGSQLYATGVARVEASGQMLEARTIETEGKEGQGKKSGLRGGQSPEALWRLTLEPTISVPPSG